MTFLQTLFTSDNVKQCRYKTIVNAHYESVGKKGENDSQLSLLIIYCNQVTIFLERNVSSHFSEG